MKIISKNILGKSCFGNFDFYTIIFTISIIVKDLQGFQEFRTFVGSESLL